MKLLKKPLSASLFTILLLLLCCCIRTVEENQSPREEEHLSVTAGFAYEDGTAFSEGLIRLSDGGRTLEYPLRDAALPLPDLPRNGDLMLELLDWKQQPQGTMRLSFSEGTIIDATTGKDGVGYVMVRRDTARVPLYFVLTDEGSLQCTLWLSYPAGPPDSPLPE